AITRAKALGELAIGILDRRHGSLGERETYGEVHVEGFDPHLARVVKEELRYSSNRLRLLRELRCSTRSRWMPASAVAPQLPASWTSGDRWTSSAATCRPS